MIEWLWGCMVLAFKAGLGGLLWSISIYAVVGIFILIGAGIGSMLK